MLVKEPKEPQNRLPESSPPYGDLAEKMVETCAERDGVMPLWDYRISNSENYRRRERAAYIWDRVLTGGILGDSWHFSRGHPSRKRALSAARASLLGRVAEIMV